MGQLKHTVKAQITWRPFQLNPTMPKEGMDRTAYLEAKFGSLDVFRQMEEHVLSAGAAERISFAFEKITRTPNTFPAHRLLWYAEGKRCQDAVVDSLFRGYFEEGADIGMPSTLVLLAERTGLNTESVERFLQSDEGKAEVQAEESAGHRLGIRGVPYFVLNQASMISGAQPVELFISAIEKVRTHSPIVAEGSTGRR